MGQKLSDQVWWGNQDLAAQFVLAVGEQLGSRDMSPLAPLFAVDFTSENFLGLQVDTLMAASLRDFPAVSQGFGYVDLEENFATAVQAIPLPAASVLLLSGLFGLTYLGRWKNVHL